MARGNKGFSQEAIERRCKEGRGKGEGSHYKPWWNVNEVPSLGQANRPYSWTTGRVHQLLSLNELHYFYLLEWSPQVVDIREQFPLFSYEETQDIACELGIKHPPLSSKGLWVLTSDFVITLESGEEVVRTVKPVEKLENNRVVELLEIERHYWGRRNIDWAIVLDEDMPLTTVENIQWLQAHLNFDRVGLGPQDADVVGNHLTDEIRTNPDIALADIACRCDDLFGLPSGKTLALARHLIATRRLRVDMTVKINPAQPLLLIEEGGV